MNNSLIQLLVLAGIAVFLILRLRGVLGTREGFEKPAALPEQSSTPPPSRDFEVIEGGAAEDLSDFVTRGSAAEKALMRMRDVEPSFSVAEFVSGAKGAYEMILMAFETGSLDQIQPFLAPEVYDSFAAAVGQRKEQGLSVEAQFYGVAETKIVNAEFDETAREAEITVSFIGELTSALRDRSGEVVDGDPRKIRKQKDIWSFARKMGEDDPNWQLVETGG